MGENKSKICQGLNCLQVLLKQKPLDLYSTCLYWNMIPELPSTIIVLNFNHDFFCHGLD